MKQCLLLLFLMACVHPVPAPLDFMGFPPSFYTEQILTIRTPEDQRQLRVQLQREKGADRLDLVLIEPLLGLVLARAVVDREGTRMLYVAPQIDETKLPLQDIGAAIRDLYAARHFERAENGFVYRPAHGLYEYRLSSIRGTADCPYPETITLQFKKDPYRVEIAVASFSCS